MSIDDDADDVSCASVCDENGTRGGYSNVAMGVCVGGLSGKAGFSVLVKKQKQIQICKTTGFFGGVLGQFCSGLISLCDL